MPRKPEIDRPTRLELKLPDSLRTRVDLYLFSDLEGKVPRGRYQEFFSERVRDFFESARLDLAPFGFPQDYYVTGPKDMIAELQRRLIAERSKESVT